MKQIIKSTQILCDETWFDGYVIVQDDTIIDIVKEVDTNDHVVDYGNKKILPGIIDIHNHGFGGWSMSDPATVHDVKGFAKAVASVGVTTVLPTAKEEAFEAIVECMDIDHDGANIFGIHSEGPFWARGGEHTVGEEWPLPSVDEAKRFVNLAKGKMKIMALAPELPNAYDVIRYLHTENILVASAHTKAYAKDIQKAMEEVGLDSVTHLCNGMQGIHHRDVGALGAYLLEDCLYYELISDLNHVCKEMIQLIFKCQPYEKIMLISDSNFIAGLPQGNYMRYHKVMIADDKGLIKDLHGRICGSGKYVLYNMSQLVEVVGIPLEKASIMASIVPARFLGIDHETGSITKGKKADFFVMDNTYTCFATYVKGKLVYDSNNQTQESVFNMDALSKRIED